MTTPKKSQKSRPHTSATGGKKAHVFDIARPGSGQVAASTTSKPVLVSNRPVARDPMMVSGSSSASSEGPVEVPDTAPVLTPTKKKVIMPLGDFKLDDDDSAEPDIESPEAEPKTPSIVQEDVANISSASEGEVPVDQGATVPELVIDDVAKDDAAVQESEAEPKDQDTKPLVKTEAGESVTVLEPVSKAGVPQADRQEKELTTDQVIAAEKTAQAREAKLQEMIDDERYFLPINAMQARRTRNFAIVGVIVIIFLALAWYNIALDAGLLPNQFNVPHTSFFTIE